MKNKFYFSKIKSPCINVCRIDNDSGLCVGCCRNEHEVFNWIYFSKEQKKITLSKIKKRVKINNTNKKFIQDKISKKVG